MSANIILVLSGLVLLTLCAGVYISNPKRAVNRALSAFLLSGLLWVLANLLANISTTKGSALFFSRATIIGGVLSPLTFLIFVATFTRYQRTSRRYLALISLLPIATLLFTFTDLNISSADIHGTHIVAGPLYVLLFAIILTYTTFGIYRLVMFRKKATPIERSQLQYIYAGVVLTIAPAVITNVLLPIFSTANSSAYGPASVVAISIFTTIAIVKHRLLDIRLVVARSFAYILALGTLGFGFAAILLAVTSIFFSNSSVPAEIKAVYLGLALILAFIYQPVKRRFDKLTNKIFYQDAYDPQTLIDELNTVLVGNIELKELLEKSANVIAKNLKVEYCAIGIKEVEDLPVRVYGTSEKRFSDDQILRVKQLTPPFGKQKVIIADDLGDKHEELGDILRTNSVGMLTRLLTGNVGIGYIILGYKKSGSPYSSMDIRIMDIIADELVIAVQNSLRFEEIQHFNVTLQEKVEDATKQLRHANHRLRELDATKDEFISMASHQLRTPLTAIKGYLSMVLEGDVGKVNKPEKEMIGQAFDSAERMVYLIADLLNVSRLQSGKFVIDNKPTDLPKMVEAEVGQLKETAEHHQLTLTYHKPDKFPMLNLDDTKIRQVIMNFMDNAIYYTPAGGSIEVALDTTDSTVSYTVTDTGLGVPKAEQHHLFGKFYRAGNARKMRPDGTGLGLFMAKKVIVAQGGAIIFKSTEGKGSTFGFSFPRSKVEIKGKPSEQPKAEPVAA